MTIDREFLAQTIWGGSMLPAYAYAAGSPGAPAGPGPISPHSPRSTPRTRQADLKAAGYGPGGKRLDVEIRYNAGEKTSDGDAVADMWRPLNVAVSFVNADAHTHFAFCASKAISTSHARLARRLSRPAEFSGAGVERELRRSTIPAGRTRRSTLC